MCKVPRGIRIWRYIKSVFIIIIIYRCNFEGTYCIKYSITTQDIMAQIIWRAICDLADLSRLVDVSTSRCKTGVS